MDFVALDVETANGDVGSICQIGLVTFRGGQIVDTWESLVNPDDYFSTSNIRIHGITAAAVAAAPAWHDLRAALDARMNGVVVAAHSGFDRSAIRAACRKYRLDEPDYHWLDTCKVARRAWPDLKATGGYGLARLARHFGIGFAHHDALEDARAAGEVLIRAGADTGLGIEDWLARVERPVRQG